MSKDRIERAKKQRILLVGTHLKFDEKVCVFDVNGTGIRIYQITWDFGDCKFTCECPDFFHRQKDCKHIYFVMMNVLKIKKPEMVDNIEIEDALKQCEKDKWHEKIEHDAETLVLKKSVTQRTNEECCICMLEFVETKKEKTTYCSQQCGITFHSECLEQLFKVVNNKNCPMCRSKLK